MTTALVIFLITYVFIGLRQIPRVHSNCLASVLTSAMLMIALCVFSLEKRVAHGAEGNAGTTHIRQAAITITPYDSPASSRAYRVALLCDTQESRTKGLQGFRQLQKDEAALFVFDKPEAVAFWMGSVSYPIDIIFVGPDKKVINVYRNCTPGSRDLYPSIKPAKWVIETAPGSGIKVKDRVSF